MKNATRTTDSFIELIQSCEPSLRGLVYRMLGSADAMEDVLQTAFMRAFEAYPGARLTRTNSGATWLHTITYRACVDELRKRRRQSDLSASAAREAAEYGRSLRATHESLEDDLASAVEAGLRDLPDDQRALLVLVYVLGFDYKHTAAILGIPAGTVASRLHTARAALRESVFPFSEPSTSVIGGKQ